MRHRPAAGGRIDHSVVGLLSMTFAVLVGISGGLLSLLLRWPGLEQASPSLRTAAQAHVPLLIFFTAVPASLGGLAVAALPSLVGARRSAFPGLDAAALGLTLAALAAFCGGVFGPWAAGIAVSADLLALATVLGSANLIATALVERTIAYAAIPCFAWTILIAATLALCAAPIMAAAYTIACWHGVASETVLPGLVWPALCVVLVLMLGLVTDILADVTRRPGVVATPALAILLGGGMFSFFMAWAYCLENKLAFAGAQSLMQGFLLLLTMPVLLLWGTMLGRDPGQVLSGGLPVLFASGFAVMLLVGLFGGLFGGAGHGVISLAVVFALLAGFFRMSASGLRHPIAVWSARAQLWLLLGGSLSLLLPMPPLLEAIGAAMSSLSIGLFMIHLVVALVSTRPGDDVIAGPIAMTGERFS